MKPVPFPDAAVSHLFRHDHGLAAPLAAMLLVGAAWGLGEPAAAHSPLSQEAIQHGGGAGAANTLVHRHPHDAEAIAENDGDAICAN